MLSVNEIFYSIQGESTYAGKPCVFVRLAGCDLRCTWCDTAYAFSEGQKMSVEDVLQQVDRYGTLLVEVTGGEPLLQEEVYPLMHKLIEYARSEGIQELYGEVLSENSTMLQMCAELGFDMAESPRDPTVRIVTLPIKSTAAATA